MSEIELMNQSKGIPKSDAPTEIVSRMLYLTEHGIRLERNMHIVCDNQMIKELTEEFHVFDVIRCVAPSEDYTFVKIIYTVIGRDLYQVVMPFRAFLNCQYDTYCKNIKRSPQCSDNDFNRAFDYAIKFASYKDKKLSWDELDILGDNLGTYTIPW